MMKRALSFHTRRNRRRPLSGSLVSDPKPQSRSRFATLPLFLEVIAADSRLIQTHHCRIRRLDGALSYSEKEVPDGKLQTRSVYCLRVARGGIPGLRRGRADRGRGAGVLPQVQDVMPDLPRDFSQAQSLWRGVSP